MAAIREMQSSEYWFLREMLYAAIYVHPGDEPFTFNVVDQPPLSKYIADFGGPGDTALVASEGEQLIGAVWSRQFRRDDPGYGFLDEQTPELSIAVKSEFRGQGLGTEMLEMMVQRLTSDGCPRVSLSVDRRSRAMKLYERIGFRICSQDGTSVTMVWTLSGRS